MVQEDIYIDHSFYEGDFKNGEIDGIGTYNCKEYKYIGEWKCNKKNKIGTYYLSNDRYLEVIIENDYIIKGIYKSAENEDLYAYNIDISTKEKEIYFIENIYKYLSKECNNEITLNSLNLYN